MTLQELLELTIKNKASDLHILTGVPPSIRIDGILSYIASYSPVTEGGLQEMLLTILKPDQKEMLISNKELDFSFAFGGGPQAPAGRFRTNIYYQRGNLAAAFRFIQPNIRTVEELRLPKICHAFANLKQGLVLVTGPTGHGKSTTLAAIINEINLSKAAHLLTIEDPIEYVYPQGKSIISQREMGIDSHSWKNALKSAIREDPDVVLVGEMRDPETISATITIAETGHLVFSTLHTNSASQTIDRIIDSFPPDQQSQVKSQLSVTLKGIVSQRLLPQINGGRVAAVEILVGTNAVASNIRDGKTHLIDSVIQTSQDVGMISLESSLASLVMSGSISLETAKSYALHPDELLRMVG
ncbi:MAG: type IV pilus twitching motility protein PilT [Candidatus Levybacteria bacterium]|nr:type IV pilus twitching motility protein PilT [Candidatus Levybacteria bacterium]